MSDDRETKPFKFVTGFDARFPNQNQTKHCWQNYVDYHKCILAKGEDFAPCRQVGWISNGWADRSDQLWRSSFWRIVPCAQAIGVRDGMTSEVQKGTFPTRLDQ
ncbi:hypothetical protein HYFRA_00000204 [Hymenoscyphus fraxineus]|uniref:Cytochrome c oxidase subunit n=1 Tax=Hymenoscyphus fraxineus TaxID=746836 RepID=A0A9N9L2F3_9HELO|nr:hypothetical protein HYFRA_00000204 [Hymenoscyphus fraxineus]